MASNTTVHNSDRNSQNRRRPETLRRVTRSVSLPSAPTPAKKTLPVLFHLATTHALVGHLVRQGREQLGRKSIITVLYAPMWPGRAKGGKE
jgi:hypothetical protein